MKRRDFIKKGSAVVATTVVGSTLASCGGGSTTPKVTPKVPTKSEVTKATSAKPAPTVKPAGQTPLANVSKTFYITDGIINMGDANSSKPRAVYFRGFSASNGELNVPGQSMIVNEGDLIELTIINTLTTSHQFKITGYDVNKKMITLADSGLIPAGQQVTFSFVASKPGSYFYEDPTGANRMIGMHGGFAVMPKNSTNELFPGSRDFVQQLTWIFNDIDYRWNDAIAANTALPQEFLPQYFTINGLSGRPPAPSGNGQPSPDSKNPAKDSMHDPRTMLVGGLGDRTLIRAINIGMAKHSMHIHANHLEWLRQDGQTLAGSNKGDPRAYLKDVIPLIGQGGICDVIYPFDAPPDAEPKFTQTTIETAELENREIAYPMHLHDEMTQTANGGSYLYGALTDIYYKSVSVTKKRII